MTRLVCLALLGVFSAAIPATAQAESVIVLGIRSMEGDDEFALSLTGALRHGASQVPGWTVSDREVSLAQMALAHGCDDPDVACMQQIAQTLGTDRVLYGTVRRTAAGSDFDFNITLYMFNAGNGQIEGVVTDTIPQEQRDIDQFRGRVSGYIARLRGTEQGGRLRIAGNVPGAEVLVDDAQAGITDSEGVFEADVESGRRRVEVRAEGYTTFRGSVTVAPGSVAELEVTLVEGSGFEGEVSAGGGVNWLGVGLIGAGVVAAAWTVIAWFTIDSAGGSGIDLIEDNAQLQAYRENVPAGRDACAEARDGNSWGFTGNFDEVVDVCQTQENFFYSEAFQVITGVIALGSIGLGVYFLTSGDDEEEEEGPALSVVPRFHEHGADLSATLLF